MTFSAAADAIHPSSFPCSTVPDRFRSHRVERLTRGQRLERASSGSSVSDLVGGVPYQLERQIPSHAFGMTDVKHALCIESAGISRAQFVLRLFVEIDHDIAAKNGVELAGHRPRPKEVQLTEANQRTHFFAHAEPHVRPCTDGLKPVPAQGQRDILELARPVNAALGLREYV